LLIGQRLRELRESKKLSQGDIERRTGLLRCYISRVEHGHTVPSVETLEKCARALEVPLYRLFYEGNTRPPKPKLLAAEGVNAQWDKNLRHALRRLAKALSRLDDRHQQILLKTAQRMASRNRVRR